MILDSQYLKLYTEYLEDEKYIEKVEAALREAYASLRWHKDALARYKAKNQGLQVYTLLKAIAGPHLFGRPNSVIVGKTAKRSRGGTATARGGSSDPKGFARRSARREEVVGGTCVAAG